MNIVEVDNAIGRETIVSRRKYKLGDKITLSPSQGGHDDGLNPVGYRVSR